MSAEQQDNRNGNENSTSFEDLVQRTRAGDQRAAAELVRRFEPAVRRVARIRLADQRLRRTLDSMDICQSVLASFFVRAAMGQYEIATPDDLLKLLAQMARNKVADRARRHHAAKRDVKQASSEPADELNIACPQPTPSEVVGGRELLEQFRARLSPEERRLAELRAQRREWDEIAAEVGGTPEALRKRLARALDRVAGELELDVS
jgi:RNA polymerase sigma-70 factor (ECF subfamily)